MNFLGGWAILLALKKKCCKQGGPLIAVARSIPGFLSVLDLPTTVRCLSALPGFTACSQMIVLELWSWTTYVWLQCHHSCQPAAVFSQHAAINPLLLCAQGYKARWMLILLKEVSPFSIALFVLCYSLLVMWNPFSKLLFSSLISTGRKIVTKLFEINRKEENPRETILIEKAVESRWGQIPFLPLTQG